jgi:hypothetical protein
MGYAIVSHLGRKQDANPGSHGLLRFYPRGLDQPLFVPPRFLFPGRAYCLKISNEPESLVQEVSAT